MTTLKTKLLTADDLARLVSQGVRGELIPGVLYETMPTGVNHARIVVKLVLLLGVFIAPAQTWNTYGIRPGGSLGTAAQTRCANLISRTFRLKECRWASTCPVILNWFQTLW